MIRKPNGWENVQAAAEGQALPLGAYVCKVKSVKVEENQYGGQLLIAFDIAEGEYKDYFSRQFAANTAQDKRWRGVLRQWLPLDNGSEKDEFTKQGLKRLTTAFEHSNPGFMIEYTWNEQTKEYTWDEQTLVGKTIGILFRKEEYQVENRRGWSVRPFRAITANRVRNGEYTLPEDRPLRSDAAEPVSAFTPSYNPQQTYQQPQRQPQLTSMMQSGFTAVTDDDLPF